jgi:hypothetical protein
MCTRRGLNSGSALRKVQDTSGNAVDAHLRPNQVRPTLVLAPLNLVHGIGTSKCELVGRGVSGNNLRAENKGSPLPRRLDDNLFPNTQWDVAVALKRR